MDFGKKIADARAKANITQQELADKLFVSRELISKWENRLRRPDYGTFTKIADALSVPVETLIRREDCVFEELEACIPQGREIPRERLSRLIGRFAEELPQPDAGMFIRIYYLLNSNAEIALVYEEIPSRSTAQAEQPTDNKPITASTGDTEKTAPPVKRQPKPLLEPTEKAVKKDGAPPWMNTETEAPNNTHTEEQTDEQT